MRKIIVFVLLSIALVGFTSCKSTSKPCGLADASIKTPLQNLHVKNA